MGARSRELLPSNLRTLHWKMRGGTGISTFLLWWIFFILCWPLALLALILYPFVWLLLLPFRLVGIAVHGALALVWAIVTFPARLLSAPFGRPVIGRLLAVLV